ncbi:hypothetical protein HAX54_049520 [Datura stramonium]|uniref:Protein DETOXIFICATION n=1 Tax=Datura stramonium TaxID=4076 RepID=A0ABS8RQR5_DATST|nr:hypothetical protein [Datura stramonium]
METPIFGSSSMEPMELHSAPSTMLTDYPPVQSFQDLKNLIGMESGKLWAIAGPIAFNILCNYGINSFTSIFVGHIGDVELSAVAISLSLGMGSALETLCGQAFGAGQVELLGVYLQRSWIILVASCFCIMPLYIFSTPILKLLGQRDDIAELAGKFSIQIIPQMFSLAINFPTQKFLQAQSNVAILAWVGFMALVMHIGVLFLFIRVFRWGVTGAAAAYDVSAWAISLAQVVYIVGWCKDSWKGLSWLALKELWPFMKLSVASAVMICLEIWYFMTIIVLTGHLEDPVIAVGSLSIWYSVAVGGGWQALVAYINLACYYVIGLPLGFLLGYKTRLGVQGIWIGMIFGTFLQTVVLCIIVYKTNWNEEVEQASERMRKWSGISDESDTK